MPDDLTEIRERIQFAKDSIAELRSDMQTFCDQNFRLTRMPTTKFPDSPFGRATHYDLWIDQKAPISTAIKSKTGLIAHELRSSLDSLACALAIRNNKGTSRTYFPISKTKEIFDDDGMKKIRDLSPNDQAKIVGLNPFGGGGNALFALHEADRQRKHTRLNAFAITQATTLGINAMQLSNTHGILKDVRMNGVRIEDMEVFPADPLAPNVPTLLAKGVPRALPIDIDISIVYADPPELENRVALERLRTFADEVSAIVALF